MRREILQGLRRYENCILTLFVVLANVIVMGVFFDFYYDLNDDTMMLDIMSGAYSGSPDGHNMQTLYPLGTLIALCYRLCGAVPWYGLFLCLCQFGCFYLIGVRLCSLGEGRQKAGDRQTSAPLYAASRVSVGRKLMRLVALSVLAWGVCLSHLMNIQYTITSAMLSATAIFLFLTMPDKEDATGFLHGNIPSMVLVVIAYQLRSEMLLLTFPFICLAGLYRLTEEKTIFMKGNLIRYGGVLGIMLAGMLVSRGLDYAAYSSDAWKDFLRLFEARTTVYDFYPELVREDRYQEALESLGVTAAQQSLLRNYDYGLDDTIDSAFLMTLADYAVDTLRGAKDWGGIVREQVYRYYYRTLRGGDAPYSILLLWMYAAVFAAGVCGVGIRRYVFLWQTILLLCGRSLIWMFIMLRERDPERITHSLYLVEFALLAAMTIRMLYRGINGREDAGIRHDLGAYDNRRPAERVPVRVSRGIALLMAAAFVLITGNGMMKGIPVLRAEQEGRAKVNENWYAIDRYCREHDENFYFEDVYSTVAFSRRIFGVAGGGYANYDIMGGWMCGSPLYYDKIGRYGIESVHEALLGQENVYLILSDQEAQERGFAWILDFYAEQGVAVVVERTDTIGTEYAAYRVKCPAAIQTD